MKKLSYLLASVLTLSFALTGCGNSKTSEQTSTSKEPTKLVVSTWGYNEDKLRKNVFEPFEKANNCKIVLEVGNNDERLNKAKSMPGSVDVIYLADSYTIQGIEQGLFEKINKDNIPNIKNIYDVAKSAMGDGYGPAYTINRTGIVYDTKTVTTPITSWNDLWRADLKKKISVSEINSTAGPALMQVAANKAGVKLSDNVDGAFKEISTLKPNIVKTYSKSSDFVNMFSQGEINVGVAQDFVFAKIKEAVPTAEWAELKEGNYANLNTINIVKGSKNKELAEKFIDWCLSEQVQKADALDKVDSPVNVKVTLTAEQAKGLTYGKDVINNLKVIDWKQYNSAKAGIIDKWNAELSK
ncbi:ABC transporter substrate-binding protein [Clostridium sp. OS1-26]|uniref:ABC transporter substrate-binding protein n=1 Tax=Clostridium sp. OS1-26 TaxID=3070681 RepID=UPI0027E1DA08|nr:ABC transporter substrate-binding protein [Clostridium sp. OS1-26]WML33384.1 ABC transporter substrate-binding protein [Clostridium sp. OS1-26]